MPKNHKITINKLSLFFNILLTVATVALATSTPLFEQFFYGKLTETIVPSNFGEKIKKNIYYSTTFKYKHYKGKSIHNVTIILQINNTGSKIDIYEPYFKTIYCKNNIIQEKSERSLKLDIPEIRPLDEFDIRIYSKVKPNISSIVLMKDGSLVNQESIQPIRSPVYWVIAFVIAFYLISLITYLWVIHRLQREKERIIKERNELQEIVLSGNRLSSRRD